MKKCTHYHIEDPDKKIIRRDLTGMFNRHRPNNPRTLKDVPHTEWICKHCGDRMLQPLFVPMDFNEYPNSYLKGGKI